jgi:hypothetical protein
MRPSYPFPWIVIPGLVGSSITGVKRPFKGDAQRLVGTLPKFLNVSGRENLPGCGPILITANHYSHPGFSMLWMAVAVSSLVPQEISWVITRAWTYEGRLQNLVLGGMSRFILGQIARDYQFIAMPAIPAQPEETIDRAMAIRKLFRLIKSDPAAFIGIAPEGQDIPGGKLGWPPPGAGRLVMEIARKGFKVLPVGIFENDDCLCVHFGQVFPVTKPEGVPAKEVDQAVSRMVMHHISCQLPADMQGEFS